MSMPRVPAARPSSSVPLQHPPWNGSAKTASTRSGTAVVSTSGVPVNSDHSRPSRTPPSRRSTPTNQRVTAAANAKQPSVEPATESYQQHFLRSPDAFEMARVHTANINDNALVTPASIFQSFLSPNSEQPHFGPVIPDWAEEQCASSSLDIDIDTQLHQLQLRLASTRDMLRASAQSQVVAQDARRKAAKGQQGGSGGLMRYTVRSDIKKKVASSNAAQDDDLMSLSDWAPPKLEMKFPWDDEAALATTAAAERQPSAESGGGESHERAGAASNAAEPSHRLQGAYHRYFGADTRSKINNPSSMPSDPPPRHGIKRSTAAQKAAPAAATSRSIRGRSGLLPPSKENDSDASTFDPQQYAQSILLRQQRRTNNVADMSAESIQDGVLYGANKHRPTTLLSPPRDEDHRHHTAAMFGSDDDKFFDDEDDYTTLLQQPALDRSGFVAQSDRHVGRHTQDNDLVSTPRGAHHRPFPTTSPPQDPLKRATVLETQPQSTQQFAPHPVTHHPDGAWSASVASVLESINFANSSHPVMLPTTFLSSSSVWATTTTRGDGVHPHRSASLRDEGEFVMARDVMTMLRH